MSDEASKPSVVQVILQSLNIEHAVSLSYHHHSNGQMEAYINFVK